MLSDATTLTRKRSSIATLAKMRADLVLQLLDPAAVDLSDSKAVDAALNGSAEFQALIDAQIALENEAAEIAEMIAAREAMSRRVPGEFMQRAAEGVVL